MIRAALLRITSEYRHARQESFKGHPLGKFIRAEFANLASEVLEIDDTNLVIKGSVGQSKWSDVPWIAFFR